MRNLSALLSSWPQGFFGLARDDARLLVALNPGVFVEGRVRRIADGGLVGGFLVVLGPVFGWAQEDYLAGTLLFLEPITKKAYDYVSGWRCTEAVTRRTACIPKRAGGSQRRRSVAKQRRAIPVQSRDIRKPRPETDLNGVFLMVLGLTQDSRIRISELKQESSFCRTHNHPARPIFCPPFSQVVELH